MPFDYAQAGQKTQKLTTDVCLESQTKILSIESRQPKNSAVGCRVFFFTRPNKGF